MSGIKCLKGWFNKNPEPVHWWVEYPKLSQQTIIQRPVSLNTCLHAVKTSVLMVMPKVVSGLMRWLIGERLSYKIKRTLSMVISTVKDWWNGNPKPLILPMMKRRNLDKLLFSNGTKNPTDFRIKVEGQIIHVHKSVLCAVSDYFLVMLQSGMKEGEEGMIHIQNTKADVMKTVIGYFYGQTTSIDWNHIKDYVDVVELWQTAEVKDILEDYIAENITPHNCTDWIDYADTYHMEYLKEVTRAMINFPTDFLSLHPSKAHGHSRKLEKKVPTTDTFKASLDEAWNRYLYAEKGPQNMRDTWMFG